MDDSADIRPLLAGIIIEAMLDIRFAPRTNHIRRTAADRDDALEFMHSDHFLEICDVLDLSLVKPNEICQSQPSS